MAFCIELSELSISELTLWKARDAVIICVSSDNGSTFEFSA
jgi:hypothetical protein